MGPALCPGPAPAALSQRVCFLSFLLPLQTHLPHFLTLSEPLLPPSSCYYNPQSPLQIALGSSPQRSSLTGPFVLSWGGCGTHSLPYMTGSCPEAGWLFLPESVSWGCYNKLPKAGRIKTSEMYSLTVLQARGGNQGIRQATLLQML